MLNTGSVTHVPAIDLAWDDLVGRVDFASQVHVIFYLVKFVNRVQLGIWKRYHSSGNAVFEADGPWFCPVQIFVSTQWTLTGQNLSYVLLLEQRVTIDMNCEFLQIIETGNKKYALEVRNCDQEIVVR